MRTQTSLLAGRLTRAMLTLAIAISLAAPVLAKRVIPENLGNGLDKLVESNLAIKAGTPGNFDGGVPLAALQASLQASFSLLAVQASDTSYRGRGIRSCDPANAQRRCYPRCWITKTFV